MRKRGIHSIGGKTSRTSTIQSEIQFHVHNTLYARVVNEIRNEAHTHVLSCCLHSLIAASMTWASNSEINDTHTHTQKFICRKVKLDTSVLTWIHGRLPERQSPSNAGCLKEEKRREKNIQYKNKTYNKYNKTLNYTKHLTLVIVDKTELLQTRQGAYHPVGSTINHHCTEK